MAVVNQCRNDPLGIDGCVSRFELLAGKNIDWNFLEWQVLQL